MKINFYIRTGTPTSRGSSVNVINELTWLHDANVTFNSDATWEAEIHAHFGIRIDPERYYVRRVRNPGKGEPPHSLTEKIKVLMKEFKMPMKVYMVQVMEFDNNVTSDLNGASASTPTAEVNRGVKRPIQNDETFVIPPPKKASTPRPQVDIDPTMPVLEPVVRGRNGDEFQGESFSREVKRAMVHKNPGRGQYHRKVNTASASATSPSPDPPRKPPVQVHQHRKVPPTASSAAAVNNGRTPVGAGRTKSSSAIESDPEAFKAALYQRAKKSITNFQLLKARHDLQQLKATSEGRARDNQWTKWVLGSPLAASILRTLFDV